MTVVKQIVGITGPADANATVRVTATFSAEQISGGTESDWGSGYKARCFIIQNGSTTYGDQTKLSTVRKSYSVTYTFPLVAAYSITAGLDCLLSGICNMYFYDVKIQVSIVKR